MPCKQLLGYLAAAVLVMAGSTGEAKSRAAQPPHVPDFSGYWILSRQNAPNYPQYGRSPGEMPRVWIVFNGYTNHGNTPPPLKPDVLQKLRNTLVRERAGEIVDQATNKCLPSSNFDMLTRDAQIDILQRADEVVVLPEHERSLPRWIFIGGQHPADLKPTVNGHSVGHWEGDTLVVDTVGVEPSGYLYIMDFIPISKDLHVQERIKMENEGKTLVFEWVFEDPQVFVKPWRVISKFDRQPAKTEAFENVCDLSQRSFDFGN